MEGLAGRKRWILLAIAVAWIALAQGLGLVLVEVVPRAFIRAIGLHGYFSLVLVLVTTLGLLAVRFGVGETRDAVWGTSPAVWALLAALLVAPVVMATSTYLGFKIALPTLIEELQRGGAAEANENTGSYGKAIVASSLPVTLLWGIVLAPIAEELLFRGALWTAITRLTTPTRKEEGAPASLDATFIEESLVVRGLRASALWFRTGGVATVVTAAVFAAMHADQAGGAGIVRVVQTACLGLALGLVRHHSGGIAAPVLLHASFNLMSLARLRKWFVSDFWPKPLPVPVLYWQLAAAGAVGLLGIAVLLRLRRRSGGRPSEVG